MAGCSHDCAHCQENCSSRTSPADFRENPHPKSHIKRVIGVVSGKGGVGKSMVTSLMAVALGSRGYSVGILDADITGPSIPKAFGVYQRAQGNQEGIFPVMSRTGVKLMSVNLLLEDETTAVIWRGPVIAGTVKQFWTDVIWGDVDFLFVDMPPGTGDVPLTVFQSIPVDGLLVVTSPQELVSMIVSKAVAMAEKMNVPILGLIENMSYLVCPDCGKHIALFGESSIERVAGQHGLPVLGRMPLDPTLATLCDRGEIEQARVPYLRDAVQALEVLL